MAYGNCKTCGAGISWDEQRRKQLNTRRPLNYDGTIHSCSGTEVQPQQQPQQQRPTNPIQKAVTTDQDQKSKDIKAAQQERRQQHRELIVAMKNLTKTIIHLEAHMSGRIPQDIEDTIGFEEYREEQRDFSDEVI